MISAQLLPLDGKYYGTKVEIVKNGYVYQITLWNSGSGQPSQRELERCPTFEVQDGHFESVETYEVATAMVDELNRSELVKLEWSDREGWWHPTEFWQAVMDCALDHSYDRGSTGTPDGLPDNFDEAFRQVVAEHLSVVDQKWTQRTVYMTDPQKDAFRKALQEVNRNLLQTINTNNNDN